MCRRHPNMTLNVEDTSMFAAEIVFAHFNYFDRDMTPKQVIRTGFVHTDYQVCLDRAIEHARKENRRCNRDQFALGRAVQIAEVRASA